MEDIHVPAKRLQAAQMAGLHPQYLYQCLTGRRDMDAKQAAELERVTEGEFRRWHVRRDWHLIWPELIGVEGAPAIADQPEASRAD